MPQGVGDVPQKIPIASFTMFVLLSKKGLNVMIVQGFTEAIFGLFQFRL
jgi:hypothetical protein